MKSLARAKASIASPRRSAVAPNAAPPCAATSPTIARMKAISLRDDFPARERQLALHEIDRLNAVGALVDRRDPRVAHVLGRARLLDIAHAAMHLNAERGDFVADVGRERLGDRRQQSGALARPAAGGVIAAMQRTIDRDRGQMADSARGVRQRLHGQQHALHVGMFDDRAHLRGVCGAFSAAPGARPCRRSRA